MLYLCLIEFIQKYAMLYMQFMMNKRPIEVLLIVNFQPGTDFQILVFTMKETFHVLSSVYSLIILNIFVLLISNIHSKI
jgi:hypothetical protein